MEKGCTKDLGKDKKGILKKKKGKKRLEERWVGVTGLDGVLLVIPLSMVFTQRGNVTSKEYERRLLYFCWALDERVPEYSRLHGYYYNTHRHPKNLTSITRQH